jgi:hypothetical protein
MNAQLDERDVAGLVRAAGLEIPDERLPGFVEFAAMFRQLLDQLRELDAAEISFGDPFDPERVFDPRWE